MIIRRKQSTQREISLSANLSTTNTSWVALGLNLGFHDEKSASNLTLSYGMAFVCVYLFTSTSNRSSKTGNININCFQAVTWDTLKICGAIKVS